MTYWHYTCDHSREAIGEAGTLVPARLLNPTLPEWLWVGSFVWMTNLPHALAVSLGLTRHLIDCDRTAHRYRVTDDRDVQPWRDVRRQYTGEVDATLRDALESEPGIRLSHWYVSTEPVPVVLDPES